MKKQTKTTAKKVLKKTMPISVPTILTTLALACASPKITEKQKEFKTFKGTRNLLDYEDFLEQQGIDVNICRAEANGIDVYIYELKKTYGTHTISEKDTIDSIVNIYGMKKQDFQNMNNIRNDETLEEGEKVKIYFYKFYYYGLDNLDENSKYYYHIVMPGETLSEIAEKYDITIEELIKVNNIKDPNKIEQSQIIKIEKEKQKVKIK